MDRKNDKRIKKGYDTLVGHPHSSMDPHPELHGKLKLESMDYYIQQYKEDMALGE